MTRSAEALGLPRLLGEPGHDTPQAGIAACDRLFYERRYEEALEAVQQAIALSPMDARLHANRGTLLALLERHEHALVSFGLAIELTPCAPPPLWMNYAASLAALGRVEEALHLYERGLQLGPEQEQAALLLAGKGEALRCLNRPTEALEAFREAERLLRELQSVALDLDEQAGPAFLTYLSSARERAEAETHLPR